MDAPSSYDILVESQANAAQIERNIAHLQDELRQKNQVISEQIRAVNANCFLNRVLSDDILLYIFSILVQVYPFGCFPWELTAVCRRWRRVCLECPSLWTRFRIWEDFHDCDSCDVYDSSDVVRTLLQLERSGSAPIHIIIAGTVCECASQVSMFEAVVAQSHRWESFRLENKYRTHTDHLRKLIPQDADFSKLQKIHCTSAPGGRIYSSTESLPLPPFSEDTILPSLYDFAFSDYAIILPTWPKFPWKQLTSLTLACTDTRAGFDAHRELLFALSECSQVTCLDLAFYEIWDSWQDMDGTEIVLPLVTKASIKYGGMARESSSTPFLPYIRLPCLQSLLVDGLHYNEVVADLIQMLDRSSCSQSLKELKLMSCIGEAQNIDDIQKNVELLLKKSPQVKALALELEWENEPDADACNRLVRCLELKNGPTTSLLCPRLEKICFTCFNPSPMTLIRTLDSRICQTATTPHCLQRVELTYAGDDDRYKFFEALINQKYSRSDLKIQLSQPREDDDDD